MKSRASSSSTGSWQY